MGDYRDDGGIKIWSDEPNTQIADARVVVRLDGIVD